MYYVKMTLVGGCFHAVTRDGGWSEKRQRHPSLSPVHTGDCDNLSPNLGVADFGDSCRFRRQSLNSATSRQCGQGFNGCRKKYW